ncbi:uncharacterized protein LOC106388544 isoform X2 [Brassica napus]|uniref:uncharacterized protein LOC106388544 isoform X2 n=1 Tax=Brassica napus TaxID=3708 RepID=UPI002079CEF5|nr:uncharacterized protein LOC106388544 isoform X2 [Brassica napus]
MATENPITTETVALTEKKMDMSLDAIIKMSKSNTNVNKGKKLRASNKKEKFNGAAKNSTVKAQLYMDSRSDVRQGAFAKRRSNFQGNHFPVTTAVARNVASGAPIRGRPYNAGRMANTNQSRSRLLDNSLIVCLITWAPSMLVSEVPYSTSSVWICTKRVCLKAAAMGEDRAKASKWRRRAEARASDAGLSVCKHERREDENEKVYRKGKQCRQQWCWTAVPAAAAMGKKSHKIPQLIYVIRRTMALLLMQIGLDSMFEVYNIHL